MAEQAEPADIGAGVHVVRAQHRDGIAVRVLHVGERGGQQPMRAARAHVRGHQHAAAERFAEHQAVAGHQCVAAELRARRDMPGDRETEREFDALGGVTAEQRRAGLGERGAHALQQRAQVVGLHALGGERQRHHGERAVGLGAHGVEIAERVHRGDAPEQPRVVDEAAEVIDALHQQASARRLEDGAVVRLGEPDRHALDRWRGAAQCRERGGLHRRRGLRATAATAHVVFARDRRQTAITAHEAAVDTVLHMPQQPTLQRVPRP